MEAVPVEDTFITGDGDQQTRALVNDGSSFDNLDKSDHYYRFLFHGNPFPGWIYDLETLQFVDVNVPLLNSTATQNKNFFP